MSKAQHPPHALPPRPTPAPAPTQADAPYGALLLLVFLSGFAALVYELLWFRRLGLVFGNTVQAAATVLTAFMIGLAWGAHRTRRWLGRGIHPIRLFGLIEAGIGLYALLVPAAFALANLAYQHAALRVPEAGAALTALRFALALLVLFVPTALMGASLPVLSEAALGGRERFATRLGVLYGSNTAGATLGVLACGFVLVPWLGVTASNGLAAAINLLVGAVAVLRLAPRAAAGSPAPTAATVATTHGAGRRMVLLGIAGACGALALGFETVWFRALVLVIGSTSHSFAIMVACFLLGLALGSSALGRLSDRPGRAAWALAAALAGIGLWTLFSSGCYMAAPEAFLQLLAAMDFTWNGMLLSNTLLGAVFLLPLSVLSGMAFTAVVRLIRDDALSSGRAVGAAFSSNALGSAAGAAAAGFVLLPALGLERSLLALGTTALALALGIPWLAPTTHARRVLSGVVVVALAVGLRSVATPWDPLLLASGPYFAARDNVVDGEVRLRQRLDTVELVHYHEGATATVDVKRTPDGRMYFSSDGKVEADTSAHSMVLQRMMGHLPMLVHHAPRHVLNIGLGAGVTAGALTCYPEVQVDVVDIEPAVVSVAALWAPRNHDLIRRGAFRLVINDGRNHLLVTPHRYDVITSDPFEPVVAGAASLYTVDHFTLARERLAADGVMAQFLPLYEMSREDMFTIIRSFVRVFPRSLLFFTGTDTILLGLTGNAELKLATVAARMAHAPVRESLTEVGIVRPERLFDMLVLDIRPGQPVVPEGSVNTDDLPIIEYSAQRSRLDHKRDQNQAALLERFRDLSGSYLAGLAPEALADVQRGHQALRTLLQASLLRTRGDAQGALKLLREAAQAAPGNPIVRSELSDALVLLADEAGKAEVAVPLYEEALRVDPNDFWALFKLTLYADAAGQRTQVDTYLRRGLTAYPESALLISLRGRLAAASGNLAAACDDFATVVRKLPQCARYWEEYARYLAQAGRAAEAQAAAARARQPGRP